MNINTVEMTLLTSNKAGILASVMMKAHKFGLVVNRNRFVKLDNNTSNLYIVFDGFLKSTEVDLIQAMESHPEIHAVQEIVLNNANEIDKTNPRAFNNTGVNLRANDLITPHALKVAEEELAKTLGPIASMLIMSGTENTKHIGDLFLFLSNHLDGEDKREFLALVSDLRL